MLNRLLTCPDRSHNPGSLLFLVSLRIYLHFVDQRFTSRRLTLYQNRRLHPVLNVLCSTTSSIQTQMQCASLFTHEKHIMKSSRTAGGKKKKTPGSSMPQPWLFALLTPKQKQKKMIRVSVISCNLMSLWCSKVCSSSTLSGV